MFDPLTVLVYGAAAATAFLLGIAIGLNRQVPPKPKGLFGQTERNDP